MPDLRRQRRLYFVISAFGLGLSLWGMSSLWRLSALPPDFPAANVSYPAKVGNVVVGSPEQLRFLTQSRPAGSVVEVRSEGLTIRARLIPQLSRLHLSLILFVGLVFLSVNILVFCARVDHGPVRDFYWCTLLYGVAIMINGIYFPRAPVWTESILPLTWIACLTLLPVFFLHMALTFPRRSVFLDRRTGVMPILVAVAVGLVAWQSLVFARHFRDPNPATWQAVLLPRTLAEVFLVAAVGVGCLVLYRRSGALELSREREQMKWLLWGFTIGVTPYVFLRTLPRLFGHPSPVPPEMDRLFELAIPMAFTLAVVRYKFLDIDIIIRRSLIYALLAGVLAGIYLGVWTLAGRQLLLRFPRYAGMIQVVAVALPMALFAPTRRLIGEWVDRTFFKIQRNYDQVLLSLRGEIHDVSSQEDLAELLQTVLRREMLLRKAVVLARRGDEIVTAGEAGAEFRSWAYPSLEPTLQRLGRTVAALNSTSRPEMEIADLPGALIEAGIRIAQPLMTDGRLLGIVLIGEKVSERRFVEEDLKLLESARVEATAALERVQLVQEVAKEALEREKLRQLEQIKSDFFSRVAHDLRTPLTSIRWTVQNLIDGVVGSPDPKHLPYLASVQAAADQLGRLVNNLLDLSRLEDPKAPLEIARVDLAGVAAESAAALKPVADMRNIDIELRLPPDLPPVRGDRGKLLDVVSNLLENAVRYSPESSVVEVTIQACGSRRQTLTVRDHGPGLIEEDRERIFERFHQGRASPYSHQRGFGLGLYVVRSYLGLMGGSATAGNHPEGGARFACELPEWEDS